MLLPRLIFRRLRALLHRRSLDAEMSEELRTHLELQAAENVQRGMTPDEARYAALRAFGGIEQIKERGRDQRRRGFAWLEQWAKDLRFGARLLRKQPAFTATVVLTLALCIGANLAIFAVVDAVLLRPLPFPEADRLVTVFNSYPKGGIERYGTFVTSYYERRGQIGAFSALAMSREGTAIVGEPGATQREAVLQVSPEFFALLGVVPAQGRAFTDAEMDPASDGVAIVTDAFWRQQLGSARDVTQRTIRVDGVPRPIVGVLPAGFRFLASRAQIFLPLSSTAAERIPDQRHGGTPVDMIGRLAPGATVEQAQAQIDAHNTAMERTNPRAQMVADAGFRSLVVPLHADHVAGMRGTIELLQAGAFLLLLIGAVNVGNLLLIRASARMRELAIRQSLGASRGQLVSQVVTETTLLTVLGGVGGIGVGVWGIELVQWLGAEHIRFGAAIGVDARWLLVALGASVALGLALSLPIAVHNLRARFAGALQTESHGGTTGRAAQRLRHGFVVAQIALAFVLLVGAGLLALSLRHTLETQPGFRPERVLTAQLSLPEKTYGRTASLVQFSDRLLTEIGRQPGVVSAGMVTSLPFGPSSLKGAMTIHGAARATGESLRAHYLYGVTGDYFGTLGIRRVAGRLLTSEDSHRAQLVCVVDEGFARQYWPGGDPLGRKLVIGSDDKPEDECFTIVGVVSAVKQVGLTETAGQGAVYFPYRNLDARDFHLVVRTERQPESLAPALRRLLREIDPGLPLSEVRPMEQRIAASVAPRRSSALLVAIFSAVAIALTAIGTYGALSYAVAQRRREIGVRLALGAHPGQIRDQFLATGTRLLALGVAAGLPGAWFAGRAMQGILFEVAPLHGAIFAGATLVIGVISFAACLLPAWRAAKVDPATALRAE